MTQPEDMPGTRERIRQHIEQLQEWDRQRRASSWWARWRKPGRDRWVTGFVVVVALFALAALAMHLIG